MHGRSDMDLEGQKRLRDHPKRRVVMRQRWEELLFLHWEMNPDLIQATLPSGLEVDTMDGKAYLGLVPFFMRGVRPSFLPTVPGISDFMECNLRTYVVGPEGPGVWFYSLDCNQVIAVELARTCFHLSYYHAEMSSTRQGDWVDYNTKRLYKSSLRHNEKLSRYRYRAEPKQQPGMAELGGLEFFQVERYLLYAANFRKNILYSGRVWHEPYQVAPAEVDVLDDHLVEVAGFNKLERPPEHLHYSQGVSVEIFGLKRC